jgi:NADPH:quinone reductase-like Zn-dependent oxidoreductase
MKAVVLHEYGPPKNLKYEDMPDPTPSEGELLIRVAASSVNPIDFKIRSGAAKERYPIEFPAILGRDIAGTVRSLGPRVTAFKPGDKILALGWKAYAELATVKAADAALLPEGLDLIESAALPLVTTTGEQLITRAAKVQPGQTILVAGAIGGVGRTAVWTAKKAGVKVIAGVRKSQLKQAAELNADAVLALDDPDALQKLGFLDAVATTVPRDTANQLLAKVKPGGIFASVVGPPSSAALHPTVQIVAYGAVPDAATLRTLAEDVLAGKFKIPIDRMLPLDHAAEAHAAAEKGGIAKILLLA